MKKIFKTKSFYIICCGILLIGIINLFLEVKPSYAQIPENV